MDTLYRANVILCRSIQEAEGYLALGMKEAALEALRRFSDNDELIDAMYDADMREREEKGV